MALAVIQQLRHSTALGEFNIIKQANERLREDNKRVTDENSAYKARTDLQPLIDLVTRQLHNEEEWKVEARGHYMKAMQRLEEIRAENIAAMRTGQSALMELVAEIKAMRLGRQAHDAGQ